jgi:hypothetical protein
VPRVYRTVFLQNGTDEPTYVALKSYAIKFISFTLVIKRGLGEA